MNCNFQDLSRSKYCSAQLKQKLQLPLCHLTKPIHMRNNKKELIKYRFRMLTAFFPLSQQAFWKICLVPSLKTGRPLPPHTDLQVTSIWYSEAASPPLQIVHTSHSYTEVGYAASMLMLRKSNFSQIGDNWQHSKSMLPQMRGH